MDFNIPKDFIMSFGDTEYGLYLWNSIIEKDDDREEREYKKNTTLILKVEDIGGRTLHFEVIPYRKIDKERYKDQSYKSIHKDKTVKKIIYEGQPAFWQLLSLIKKNIDPTEFNYLAVIFEIPTHGIWERNTFNPIGKKLDGTIIPKPVKKYDHKYNDILMGDYHHPIDNYGVGLFATDKTLYVINVKKYLDYIVNYIWEVQKYLRLHGNIPIKQLLYWASMIDMVDWVSRQKGYDHYDIKHYKNKIIAKIKIYLAFEDPDSDSAFKDIKNDNYSLDILKDLVEDYYDDFVNAPKSAYGVSLGNWYKHYKRLLYDISLPKVSDDISKWQIDKSVIPLTMEEYVKKHIKNYKLNKWEQKEWEWTRDNDMIYFSTFKERLLKDKFMDETCGEGSHLYRDIERALSSVKYNSNPEYYKTLKNKTITIRDLIKHLKRIKNNEEYKKCRYWKIYRDAILLYEEIVGKNNSKYKTVWKAILPKILKNI